MRYSLNKSTQSMATTLWVEFSAKSGDLHRWLLQLPFISCGFTCNQTLSIWIIQLYTKKQSSQTLQNSWQDCTLYLRWTLCQGALWSLISVSKNMVDVINGHFGGNILHHIKVIAHLWLVYCALEVSEGGSASRALEELPVLSRWHSAQILSVAFRTPYEPFVDAHITYSTEK